jgi:glycerol-3-phosphate acyltransferase PlsY
MLSDLNLPALFALAVAGYLVGSVPVAWLITKAVTGKDLRQLGSGNVGVMNVALSVHRWAGVLVFLGELAKGIAAVALARRLAGTDYAIGLTVLAAVAGTRWMIWLRGAGGRGNTAGVGAMLVISPLTVGLGLLVWALARLGTGTSFVATRISFVVWPLIFGWLTGSWWYLAFGYALVAVYLAAQRRATDDHELIKKRWPSLWAFLTGPRRK